LAQTELPADNLATTAVEAHPSVPRATAWAWGVCWLMFASTVLNYMDRQTIALVGPQIKSEFHLRNEDFGWVLAAFSLTYALFQVPAGYLVDRWNVRWAYAGAVTWWSLAAMAAAYSPTLGVLAALRALLGVGESFNWPCALRVTGTILPPSDRSLGNGIFNSGAAVGAVLTPLVVTPIAASYGWRSPFLIVGSLGFVWVALWLFFVGGTHRYDLAGRRQDDQTPTSSPALSTPARWSFGGVLVASFLVGSLAYWIGLSAIWLAIALVMSGILVVALLLPADSLRGADWTESLGAIVRLRRFWVLMVVTVSINVCWHFLLNWLPTYIKEDVRTPVWLQEWVATPLANALALVFRSGVDPNTVGNTLLITMPFLAADLGNLLGGASSRFLAGRGYTAVQSRLAVMGLCTFVISSGAWVGKAGNANVAIYLLSLMAMGTAAFMANYFAFAQEVSSRYTGLIVGILGAFGNLFAAGFLPFAGKVRDTTGGFAPIFVLVGLMPFVGLAALVFKWGEPLSESKPA
jgi:ACS family hexuronate transporter-like MFS transporter